MADRIFHMQFKLYVTLPIFKSIEVINADSKLPKAVVVIVLQLPKCYIDSLLALLQHQLAVSILGAGWRW